MRNIPDHVRAGDPDAPWNQNHPEPNYFCPYDPEIGFMRYDYKTYWADEWTQITEFMCPECGRVVNARRDSTLSRYLYFWRISPRRMEDSIDYYSELKEVPNVDDE